jgi:Ca-activated chloride channel homolog
LISIEICSSGSRRDLMTSCARRRTRSLRSFLLSAGIVAFLFGVPIPAQTSHKPKPPKPEQLDANISFERDKDSGELRLWQPSVPRGESPPGGAPNTPHALRVSVNLVPVNCNVFAAAGSSVAGLAREDFRLFQDGIEQRIAYFDAGNDPASVALVIDASPSVLPDASAVQDAARGIAGALAPRDEVAVVEFSAHSYVLAPFSRDRAQLEDAIARVNVRELFGDTGGSNIYETVYLVAQKLFRGRTGRKAILLLTDGEDNGLGLTLASTGGGKDRGAFSWNLTFDDVVRGLASEGVEVYAVSTQHRPKVLTDDWLAAHSGGTLLTEQARNLGIPAYTLFLAELVRRAGGGLYFLRQSASGRDAFEKIAGNIRTQYTLGFYPTGEKAATAGWHALRVESTQDSKLRIVNRAAYYVPGKAPQ